MKVEDGVRDELAYLFIWHHRLDTRGDGEVILNWLLGHYKSTPYRPHTPWLTRIEPEFWPDVCCLCGTDYGLTPAGRIRRGCPVCRDEGHGELLFAWRRYTGLELDSPQFYRLAKTYRRKGYEAGRD